VDNDKDTEEQKAFNKVFRIIGFKFIRSELVSYIFENRKIKQVRPLLRYKRPILNGFIYPEKFVCWNPDKDDTCDEEVDDECD
jgi:hypothetical protein